MLKAFYRLINNMKVTAQGLYDSYQLGLIELVENNKSVPSFERMYCYSDTTFGKYHSRKGLELGYIEHSNDNGCVIHTAILSDKNYTPLGIASQEIIIRDKQDYGKSQDRSHRSFEEKESSKWIKAMKWTKQFTNQTAVQVIHVMDREADIAEVFNYAFANDQHFLVRANHNRKLNEESLSLKDFMRQQIDCQQVTRQLLDSKGKSHDVICEIRYAKLEVHKVNQPIWCITLTAIAPCDEESKILEELEETEWFLLTNVAVENYQTANELVQSYTHRWKTCEDFHKCLKTGCSIEKRQFEDLKSISTVIAMLSLAAIHLLRMRYLGASTPDTKVDQILDQPSIQLAEVLAQQYLKPIDLQFCKPNTALWLVLLIARLGGHQGIKQKGLPGWQTLFKGWKYFHTLLYGINLSKNFLNET